jgi:steroid 5-alpha reductase family enzyme
LAAFWFFQAAWVLVGSLPVILLNATCYDAPFSVWDAAGWILYVLGFTIEAVADYEKFTFRSDPANKGCFCNAGMT